ncbi:hypothetical protein [Pseudovibrio exalbescens]|uniref:hypothetical protein n=1 Tax=Pseudovibrio exalbescens TaxID=197461 RepID=UPI000C9C482F|nr:hypothetical protein [Pseudovibrio exalbescens]
MDLSSIKPRETAPVEIMHPGTGENLGLRFEIRSRYDDAVKKKAASVQLRASKMTPAQRLAAQETWAREILAAAVVSWEFYDGLTFNQESEPECNEANVVQLFKEYPYVFEQLDTQFGDVSGFFTK